MISDRYESIVFKWAQALHQWLLWLQIFNLDCIKYYEKTFFNHKNVLFFYLDIMISRFLLKSTTTICCLCQQRLTRSLIFLHQQQQRRNISTLLSKSSVQTYFSSLRFLSKSTKTNKKYQVCYTMMLSINPFLFSADILWSEE
jgi:hypothetical protein